MENVYIYYNFPMYRNELLENHLTFVPTTTAVGAGVGGLVVRKVVKGQRVQWEVGRQAVGQVGGNRRTGFRGAGGRGKQWRGAGSSCLSLSAICPPYACFTKASGLLSPVSLLFPISSLHPTPAASAPCLSPNTPPPPYPCCGAGGAEVVGGRQQPQLCLQPATGACFPTALSFQDEGLFPPMLNGGKKTLVLELCKYHM